MSEHTEVLDADRALSATVLIQIAKDIARENFKDPVEFSDDFYSELIPAIHRKVMEATINVCIARGYS